MPLHRTTSPVHSIIQPHIAISMHPITKVHRSHSIPHEPCGARKARKKNAFPSWKYRWLGRRHERHCSIDQSPGPDLKVSLSKGSGNPAASPAIGSPVFGFVDSTRPSAIALSNNIARGTIRLGRLWMRFGTQLAMATVYLAWQHRALKLVKARRQQWIAKSRNFLTSHFINVLALFYTDIPTALACTLFLHRENV